MSKLIKPEGYHAILNLKQTELAIKQINWRKLMAGV